MDVNTTTNTSAALLSSDTSGSSRIPSKILSQEDFLKILVKQMSSQDPLNPQSNTDFSTQMIQFNSFEQTKTMAENISRLNTQQEFTQAAALLGRSVQVRTSPLTVEEGKVTALQLDAGHPTVVVNGLAYEMSQIVNVTPDGTK